MLSPENQQLLEKLQNIDKAAFERALLKLFDLIDDRPTVEHIAAEFMRFHESQAREGVGTLSPLAMAALIAILDNVSFGRPFDVDHVKMKAFRKASNAGNN